MAKWIEITLEAGGAPEALCETLEGLGVSGYVIEDDRDFHRFLEQNTQYWDFVDEALEQDFIGVSRVKFWLEDAPASSTLLAKLHSLGLQPQTKAVQDADWENSWKSYYKPVEIGQKLVIVPQWETVSSARTPVVLDPGLLFGTGTHATTRMCLQAAERHAAAGRRVLDIGCGSGILGIAAAVLGCGSVTAADIDEKAPDVVGENAALNHCREKFTVLAGDVIADAHLRKKLGGGYDLVFANIVADVIIALAPHVRGFMGEGAAFICSGIIDGREAEVEQALREAGLRIEKHQHEEEWHCFECR